MEKNTSGVYIKSVAAGASVAVATNISRATAMGDGGDDQPAVVAVAQDGETVVVTNNAPEQIEDPRLTSLKEKHDVFVEALDDHIRAGRKDLVRDFLRYQMTAPVHSVFGLGGGPGGLGGGPGGFGGGLGAVGDTPVCEWSLKPRSGAGAPVMGGFALGQQTPPELMLHVSQSDGKLVRIVVGDREMEAKDVTMEVVVTVPGAPPARVPFNAPLEIHVPEGGCASFHTHVGSIRANVHGNVEHISSTQGAVTVYANEVARVFGPVTCTESGFPARNMCPQSQEK